MSGVAELLRNRQWLKCSEPFPHIVTRNVFRQDFYLALESEIRSILARGLSESPAFGRFSRNLPGYDAYGLGMAAQDETPTGVFLSPAWRNMLAELWNISPTPYVFAGAHHHLPGSKSGFIHNDFNPVWFPRSANGQIRTPDQSVCSYKTGAGPMPASEKIEVVRGAALLFYVANDPWWPGDGGETGLYSTATDPVGEPAATWPPENNSLLSFECTPDSFHTFIGNTRIPRTTIIMWIHRPLDEAIDRYGAQRLERWKS